MKAQLHILKLFSLLCREVLTNTCGRIRVLQEVNSISLKWKHSVKGYLGTNQCLSHSHHGLDKGNAISYGRIRSRNAVFQIKIFTTAAVHVLYSILTLESVNLHTVCWRSSTSFVLLKILEVLQGEKSYLEDTFVVDFCTVFSKLQKLDMAHGAGHASLGNSS